MQRDAEARRDPGCRAGRGAAGTAFSPGFRIFVLSGEGITYADGGEHPLKKGDTILLPAGEPHVTRNTGTEPLMLLCFFPVADVAEGTKEAVAQSGPG